LAELAALLDWTEIDRHLVGIPSAARGEPGWPPLALFRGLLLATWHDLSDIRLAEALDDRTSFRRFCGFAAHGPTPECTAFVRFRRELVRRGLDRVLFEAVTRRLEAKGVMVRTGTLVDATLIPSASIRQDGEAKWAGHRRRKPVHGDKAHLATDQGAGLVRGVEVTTANVHDAAELEAVLPPEPGDVYGDSAFAGGPAERVIVGRGGRSCTVWTGIWGCGPEALARLQAHNRDRGAPHGATPPTPPGIRVRTTAVRRIRLCRQSSSSPDFRLRRTPPPPAPACPRSDRGFTPSA
jgi:IS5 family transposase